MQTNAFSTCHLALVFALAWLGAIDPVRALSTRQTPHQDLTNSTTAITANQSEQAGTTSGLAASTIVALEFERSNWANGSVDDEEFYRVPPGTADAPAGTLLKVQEDANTSAYTLPPDTALSRILFQTENLNGSTVPASAYILWPYLPRTQPNGGGYPVIGWGHGTSGGFGNCAPSHVRNLWYQFTAPYPLVLQGYVVVAPDYAGLGVVKDAKGRPIIHQYLANPSHANDLFYSVQAAQAAFKVLAKEFVIVGHSQGGGAAWGAAQRQALKPVEGYLGAVAGSPVTNIVNAVGPLGVIPPAAAGFATLVARGISSVFPEFELSSILTRKGLDRLSLASKLQGCNSVLATLFNEPGLTQPDALQSFYARAYTNLTANGGRPISGPLLVLQGSADQIVNFALTTNAVDQTCALYPQSQLEYATFANVSHVPVMYAAQRLWLQWIEDRFAGAPAPRECRRSDYESARPAVSYQREPNWFLGFATLPYQVA